MGLEQIQTLFVQQMMGFTGMGTVNGNEVHMGQHLIQAFPVGRLQFGFDLLVQTPPVMVVNGHAEAFYASGDGLADAAHTDNAEPFAGNPVADHECRRPPFPFA